jgi:hypothetical protein
MSYRSARLRRIARRPSSDCVSNLPEEMSELSVEDPYASDLALVRRFLEYSDQRC